MVSEAPHRDDITVPGIHSVEPFTDDFASADEGVAILALATDC